MTAPKVQKLNTRQSSNTVSVYVNDIFKNHSSEKDFIVNELYEHHDHRVRIKSHIICFGLYQPGRPIIENTTTTKYDCPNFGIKSNIFC